MGGSAQNTSSVQSSIDFAPIIQFGSQQDANLERTSSNEASLSPEQSGGGSLGVGVGVGGGSGSAAMPTTSVSGDKAPVVFSDMPGLNAESPLSTLISNPTYLLVGGALIGAVVLLKKKKK